MFVCLTVCTWTMCLLASQFVLGLCVCLPHSLYWDYVFACLTVFYWDYVFACLTVCTGTMSLLASQNVLGLCVC